MRISLLKTLSTLNLTAVRRYLAPDGRPARPAPAWPALVPASQYNVTSRLNRNASGSVTNGTEGVNRERRRRALGDRARRIGAGARCVRRRLAPVPPRGTAATGQKELSAQAQADAEQIRERAQADADRILGRAAEAAEQAAQQAADGRREVEDEIRAVKEEMRQLRGDLERREQRIGEREQRLDDESRRLEVRAQALDSAGMSSESGRRA